jgi:hypothetical protein
VLLEAQENRAEVDALLEECLALAQSLGFKEVRAEALQCLGQLTLAAGDEPQARAQLEESVALFRDLGLRFDTAETLRILARVLAAQGPPF